MDDGTKDRVIEKLLAEVERLKVAQPATSPSDGEWELMYHVAPFGGRGEYVRLIFEDAGVPYKDVTDQKAMVGLCDAFTGGANNDGYPVFAPPILRKGTRMRLVQYSPLPAEFATMMRQATFRWRRHLRSCNTLAKHSATCHPHSKTKPVRCR